MLKQITTNGLHGDDLSVKYFKAGGAAKQRRLSHVDPGFAGVYGRVDACDWGATYEPRFTKYEYSGVQAQTQAPHMIGKGKFAALQGDAAGKYMNDEFLVGAYPKANAKQLAKGPAARADSGVNYKRGKYQGGSRTGTSKYSSGR